MKLTWNLSGRVSSITRGILEEGITLICFSSFSKPRGGGGSCTLRYQRLLINIVRKKALMATMLAPMDTLHALGKTSKNTISSGPSGRKCVTSSTCGTKCP
jgi:hypothetical protein